MSIANWKKVIKKRAVLGKKGAKKELPNKPTKS